MMNSICSDVCVVTAVGTEEHGFHMFTYILLSGLEVKAKEFTCVCNFALTVLPRMCMYEKESKKHQEGIFRGSLRHKSFAYP